MIEFLSSWAKSLGLAIVAVSILEMLLPNNKTKKYVRMVMGMYILFSIVSPLIENKNIFDINEIELENTQVASTTSVNQISMDERIEELYIQELEKDISKKVEQKGFEVKKCKVNAIISEKEDESKITKIKLDLVKKEIEQNNNKEEFDKSGNDINEIDFEEKMVTEIQKIKTIEPIDTSLKKDTSNKSKDVKEIGASKVDIQNIKKFLIEEYGVSEKCLEVN